MHSNDIALGWSAHFQQQIDDRPDLQQPHILPARVSADYGAQLEVLFPTGARQRALLTGRLRHIDDPLERPGAGDWVLTTPIDDHMCMIIERLEPHTQLARRAAGTRTRAQVLGVNLDVAFVVTSMNQDFNPRRLERYLTLIHSAGITPVLVLNKLDLTDDPERYLTRAEEVSPGTPCVATDALTGVGIEEMLSFLGPGRTGALFGSSGVGKSTLTNALLGEQRQATAAIREDDDEGRHTTTHRALFSLGPDRGLLLDTPGMRELQLWDADGGVGQVFEDIEALLTQCRFRDCQHESEPGCALLEALDAGDIDPARVRSWRGLQREIAYEARKVDEQAALKLRQEQRRFGRMIRKITKKNPKR